MSASEIFDSLCKERNAWPFKDMLVGDVVEFGEDLGEKARHAAQSYRKHPYGMKFKTRKDKSTGKMYIKRIA